MLAINLRQFPIINCSPPAKLAFLAAFLQICLPLEAGLAAIPELPAPQNGTKESSSQKPEDKLNSEAGGPSKAGTGASQELTGAAPEKAAPTEGSTNLSPEKSAPQEKSENTNTPGQKASETKPPEGSSTQLPTVRKKRKSDLANVLPCLTWIDPDIEPKAVILCVHGLGLNNGSYGDFGKRMSKLGYLVYAVDVPGFGSFKQAEGRERVNFELCLEGLADTLRFIHRVNPKLPVFILGESMGGAIALRVTSEHPELMDGLVSSVPSGDRFKQGKEALNVALKLLTAPNKEFDIGSGIIERATEDCSLRERWAGDPLNRMNLTPKELLTFQNFMNENHDSAAKIKKTPVLFVQGCKDKLVRPEGTQQLFNAIGSEDRQIELIQDGEHLIFEENQFTDEVIEKLDKWLSVHIAQKESTDRKQITNK
ncbi:MAG: lysophospholipase [Candidatus Obscuribacterales bacterium]|nr:lysophospholipase [Candidatus Obscuribacterales bacterium]